MQKCRAFIIMFVTDRIFTTLPILPSDTAAEIWNKLEKRFASTSFQHQLMIRTEISRLQFDDTQDINEYIATLRTLYDRLASCGIAPNDGEIIAKLLTSLPPSWQSTAIALETASDGTLDTVSRVLQQEQTRRKLQSPPQVAMHSHTPHRKSPPKCDHCKRKHKTENCWQLHPERKPPKCSTCHRHHASGRCKERHETANVAMDNDWLIDGGASSHMVSNKELLSEYRIIHKTPVSLANGSVVYAIGQGNAKIFSQSGSLHLQHVLHVPDLHRNLFSPGAASDQNISIQLINKVYTISQGSTVITVPPTGHLHILTSRETASAALANANCSIWHRRLGHICMDMKKIQNATTGFKDCDKSSKGLCTTCVQAKQTVAVIPQESRTSPTTQRGQTLHADLIGPYIYPTSIGGKRYTLTIVDDFTRYSFVYNLSQKSEAATEIKNLIALLERQYNIQVMHFHSDRGGEFVNQSLQSYLATHGIIFTTSAPDTPQQNSVAERYMQPYTH